MGQHRPPSPPSGNFEDLYGQIDICLPNKNQVVGQKTSDLKGLKIG